jgi:hypothetical protein
VSATVRDEIAAFACANRMNLEELIRMRLDDHLAGLSERYRLLATEVLLRLTSEWDSHAHWEMREGGIEHEVDHHLAGSRLFEWVTAGPQHWEVVLCSAKLDHLPDPAVRGVIAHELGHVASGLPSDKAVRNDELSEDRADAIARWWGFEVELQALKAACR